MGNKTSLNKANYANPKQPIDKVNNKILLLGAHYSHCIHTHLLKTAFSINFNLKLKQSGSHGRPICNPEEFPWSSDLERPPVVRSFKNFPNV
jgi:hypothetical protein